MEHDETRDPNDDDRRDDNDGDHVMRDWCAIIIGMK